MTHSKMFPHSGFLTLPMLAVLSATSSLSAADGFLDLRVGYTFADTTYDAAVDGGTSEQFEQDWDENHRVFAQLIGSPNFRQGGGGWLFGVDVASNWRDADQSNGIDVEYQAWSAHLHLGYGLPIGPVFQVELVPFFGAGISDTKRKTLVSGEESSEDTLLEYGANLSGVFHFGSFVLGAQVGYMFSETNAEFRDTVNTNDEVEYDLKSGDVMYSGFLGFRF